MNDGSPTRYYPTLSCLTYTNNQSQAEASSHRQCNCPGRSLPLPSNLEVVSTHPLIRSSTIHTHNNDLQPSPCYSPHKQQLQYKRATLRVQSRKHYAITRPVNKSHHLVSPTHFISHHITYYHVGQENSIFLQQITRSQQPCSNNMLLYLSSLPIYPSNEYPSPLSLFASHTHHPQVTIVILAWQKDES